MHGCQSRERKDGREQRRGTGSEPGTWTRVIRSFGPPSVRPRSAVFLHFHQPTTTPTAIERIIKELCMNKWSELSKKASDANNNDTAEAKETEA